MTTWSRWPSLDVQRTSRAGICEVGPVDPGAYAARRAAGPVLPRSMRITGRVADWGSWTGMRFPETGEYVFPKGLATVHIDRDRDTGQYWEPNVWLILQSRPGRGPG